MNALKHLVLIGLVVPLLSWAQCPPVNIHFDSCGYTPVGHRGGSAVFPENTLLSIEQAFKHGVKYTEVDVSVTKDGKYVLFHDVKSVYRTTNGSGNLEDYTLAELLQLDAGKWRGEQFAGTRIPTLVDALKLAEKYDAHLYLDIKASNFLALKASLEEAEVAPYRMVPSIESISQAQAFRAILPQTPWIWFGGGNFPADVTDKSFYQQCVQLGCIAFEITSENINDSNWIIFRDNVHEVGAMAWAYTVNDNSELAAFVAAGVDGMESDRPWESGNFICNGIGGSGGYDSSTTGNWLFSGNLSATHIGSQLRPLNYANTPANQSPEFASCSVFSIPFVDGQNKVVMRFPAQDSANGLLCFSNSRIEENGIEEATYSIVMDVLRPNSSTGKWISILQTNTHNLNDADVFINPTGGIGISESYHGNIAPNVWYRIGITVDGNAGIMKKYINGTLVGTTNLAAGGRWDVWNSSRAGDDQGFLLFADDDGETSDLFVSALQYRNYVLTPSEMNKLGGISASGIKIGNADAWHAKLDIAFEDSTIMDYENQTYYFVVPNNAPDSAILSFNLYGGATANIPNTLKIKPTNGTFTWNVASQDSTQFRTWKACIRKTSTTTGINETPRWTIQNVYPNPAQTVLNIPSLPSGDITYQISNVMGQVQAKGIVNQNQIEVSNLVNGVYVVTLTSGNQTASTKFVVIH